VSVASLDPVLIEQLRPLSKSAFGQEMRLALVLSIGREPRDHFLQKELAGWLGIDSFSSIARPFESLLAIGAVARIPNEDRSLILLHRRKSTLWAYGEELLAAFLSRPGPDTLF
jgi:hypothetical protein